MDLRNLLAEDTGPANRGPDEARQYVTRHSATSQGLQISPVPYGTSAGSPVKLYGFNRDSMSASPAKKDQKRVTFELLLPMPQHRARLPMRVMISRNDTTESIITTVKNFYGLYDGPGVAFEDRDGNILIANYENFEHDMTVYVTVTPEHSPIEEAVDLPKQTSMSPRRPKLGAPFDMRPPFHTSKQDPSMANGRSPSPQSTKSTGGTKGKSRARSHKSQEANGVADSLVDEYSSDGGDLSLIHI